MASCGLAQRFDRSVRRLILTGARTKGAQVRAKAWRNTVSSIRARQRRRRLLELYEHYTVEQCATLLKVDPTTIRHDEAVLHVRCKEPPTRGKKPLGPPPAQQIADTRWRQAAMMAMLTFPQLLLD